MRKKKLDFRRISLAFVMLFLGGCDWLDWDKITNSGSSSNSSSKNTANNTTQTPAHGQVTVNLLERSPFNGKNLNTSFWTDMENYCKAGPTRLILADMALIPGHMERAGFSAPVNQLYYALASTYAGIPWAPGDATSQVLSDNRDQIDLWWYRYMQAIVGIMQRAPQTTILVISNDDADRLGSRLGDAMVNRHLTPFSGRYELGNVLR